ncbi:Histidine kinase [Neomoorella glycerini]|uniref:Oxygen sensor histidine kinase NreB n=1 Tax=Neomoorella glycerini TaxID=55779 RepID=A0A6I5ZQK0_9FIRM|nr:ATP-binding protein [Moorella glycerini]QGP91986.1 Histidine kinase [Moorella glycerini]
MNPSLHFLTRDNWYWSLLLFVYGLSFFLMGFGIIIQARRGSDLRLGRRLPLLAVFGLLHGLVEWGYIFIPTAIVAEGWQTMRGMAVNGGHALLLALSYLFLLAFGINLLADTRGWPAWMRFLPLACFGGWLLFSALSLPQQSTAVASWLILIEITARYLLAAPGAAASGLAILAQGDELRHLRRGSLRFFLAGAAGALFLYAFGGGLIVPPAPFFPASFLNTSLLLRLGLPAQALRILSSILVAFFIFRLLDVYDAEERHYRETAREREMIWRERERIRRDLHDGLIQSIYGLALGLEHSRSLLAENPAVAAERLAVLKHQAEEVISGLRGYLAGLHLGRELPADPVALMKRVVTERVGGTGLKVNWCIRGNGRPHLDADQRDHLYHMLIEILSNIRRHAGASEAWIGIDLGAGGFRVEIKDNGTGLPAKVPAGGLGLENLRQRAALAGGWLEIEGWPGAGTTVTFWLPYGGDGEGRDHGHSRGAGR